MNRPTHQQVAAAVLNGQTVEQMHKHIAASEWFLSRALKDADRLRGKYQYSASRSEVARGIVGSRVLIREAQRRIAAA